MDQIIRQSIATYCIVKDSEYQVSQPYPYLKFDVILRIGPLFVPKLCPVKLEHLEELHGADEAVPKV